MLTLLVVYLHIWVGNGFDFCTLKYNNVKFMFILLLKINGFKIIVLKIFRIKYEHCLEWLYF